MNLELEWNLIKNSELLFSDFKRGSHYFAWWTCSTCSFEWQAQVTNRVIRKSGCPECNKIKKRGSNSINWKGYKEISSKHWKAIIRDAKRRSIEFDVTIEFCWDLLELQNHTCVFSGRKLIMRGNQNGKYSGNASLDRIDSSKGYVKGNLQWIDKEFQQMKMNIPDDKFISLCLEVAKKRGSTF